jgi:hypothetical protein
MHARISAVLAVAVTVTLALVLAGPAGAQVTTGTIEGRIVDTQQLPVPGVTVTVTGPQGARTVVTDTDGRFQAPFLTPGTYTVRAELTGFRPIVRENITVSLNQTVDLGLRLEPGGVTETVNVTAASPVVDMRTTTVGGVLDSTTLEHLPVGRAMTDTLYVLPGVSESPGLGRANPSIAGSTGLENNYIVDGVNVTDPGFGGIGAYNSIFGSLGSGVTSDFIKETQVKTAGFDAEYGQATGGVVNVVTKSGGNAFTGSVFGYSRPSWLEAGWKQLTTPNGSVNTTASQTSDAGVSLGGPIVKDRLFFYGTYNPQWQTQTFVAPDGFPFASLGGVDRVRHVQSYAGKVTGQLDSGNRLDFSAFGDPSKGPSGLQRYSTLRRIAYPGAPGTTDIEGGYSALDYGGHNQTLRYDGVLSSKWLLEASISHAQQHFTETPTVNAPRFRDFRSFAIPQGTTGGLGSYENDDSHNMQYTAKSTNIFEAGGVHQVRYGITYQDIGFTRDFLYSGSPVPLANGAITVTGAPVDIHESDGVTYYRATRGKIIPTAETTQQYTSVFLQDTYQVGRFTIRPGLRYERQHLQGIDPTVETSQPVLCTKGETRPGANDGTGGPMPCQFTWNNWAPRIGATYDLTGTGKAKVYASWGYFYAKIPNDLAARAMSSDYGISLQDYADPALTQPIPNGVVVGDPSNTKHLQLTSPGASVIDPNAKSTYSNETLVGFELDAFGTNLGVRYIHRTTPRILEDIGQLPMVAYFLPESADVPVDYFITNVNASTPVVNCCGLPAASFEDPSHVYNAVELTANRRFGNNWSALASYRWSRLRGNFEGFFRSDNGQSDPSITSLFDFPTNDPSYTLVGVPQFNFEGDIRYLGTSLGEGILPADRTHQLKLYGTRTFGDFNLGAGVNLGSGKALTALAANPLYQSAGEIPLTVRGAGMQTVDGFRVRTPMEARVDLHADYAIRLANNQRVVLVGDIFNLFNRRAALDYNYWTDTTFGAPNPDFGQPTTFVGDSSLPSFQAPLALRVGARFEW